ncbi:carbohydrate ABC transporter permease [Herbiconiux sp. UC225_62]|uniref:carbohydrate ABC transporter permease n=1 Tax=Herbiconiux sp. UC225_62 TaxID=3350168 RepID=UPI0036D41D5C
MHIALILFVIVAIGPILIVVMNSLKTTPGIFNGPFLPPTAETFNLDGWANVFKRGNFALNYGNSIIVTLVSTALTLVLSTLAAFAITEYKVRLAPLLAGFFIIGIMLPIRLGTVPILQTMVAWHLVDTLVALILVYTAMSLPLAIALMATFFRRVPMELKEAAKIDGAGGVAHALDRAASRSPGARRRGIRHHAADLERPVVPAHPRAEQREPDRHARGAAVRGAVPERLPRAARGTDPRRVTAGDPLHRLLAQLHPGPQPGLRQVGCPVSDAGGPGGPASSG